MPQTVNIKGIGKVNFPDNFTPEQIQGAIERDILPKAQPAPEPMAPAQPEATPGLGRRALDATLGGIGAVAQKIDAFTGAPIRGAISAMQDESESSDPSFLRLPGAALKGAVRNFGSSNVPSGKEIFERAGYSGEGMPSAYPNFDGHAYNQQRGGISPAGALGFALDLAAPVPGVGQIKAVGVGMGMAAKGTAKGAFKATAKAGNIAAGAVDAVTNTKAGTKAASAVRGTVDFAKEKAKQATDGIKAVYGGAPTQEWGRWERVAKENGIDPATLPESFKFGKHSISSRLERYHAQDDIMGEQLRDKWQGAWTGIQEALGRKVDDIAGSPGVGYGGAAEAGQVIRKRYADEVDAVFSDADNTYRGIAESHPKTFLPPATRAKLDFQLNKIQAYANDLVKNSADKVSRAQGAELLETIAQARGKTNFGEFVTAMQGIGRSAFKSYGNTGAILPPDVAKLRQMYNHMSEAAVDGVERQIGKETADALRVKNAKITDVNSDKHILKRIGAKDVGDENLFKSLTSDPLKIQALKKYLDPQSLQTTKAAYLRELMTDRVNGEGSLSFKGLHNALRTRRHAVHTLFDARELAELRDLVEMGSNLQPMMLSTSGTGSTMMTKGLLGKVGNMITSPLQTAGAGVDAVLSARQKAKSRAIGFELDPPRQAAEGGSLPPMMGFGETARGLIHGGPAFRKKAFQMYGAQNGEDEK